MTLLAVLYNYLTNQNFRSHVKYVMVKMKYADDINQKLQEELNNIIESLKNRVDVLESSIGIIKPIPQASVVISPLNDLLNELKEDYRIIADNV